MRCGRIELQPGETITWAQELFINTVNDLRCAAYDRHRQNLWLGQPKPLLVPVVVAATAQSSATALPLSLGSAHAKVRNLQLPSVSLFSCKRIIQDVVGRLPASMSAPSTKLSAQVLELLPWAGGNPRFLEWLLAVVSGSRIADMVLVGE